MLTKKLNLKEILDEEMKDPEFAAYYLRYQLEYELVAEIIKHRKEMDLTQQMLAQESGVRQQVISRMERHQSFPNLVTLSKIAKALGLRLTFQEFKSSDQIKE
jgi:DNA-binding phage protein